MKRKLIIVLATILLAGPFILAADGDPDTTLNTNGRVTTDFDLSQDLASDIALLPDGRFVVVGGVVVGGLPRFGLTRYLPSGELDLDFGTGGRTSRLGTNSGGISARGVAIQPDGKIVVVGIGRAGGQFDFDYIVARFLPNGAPDSTFGVGGLVQFNMATGNQLDEGAEAVALQEDGRIVVVGSSGVGTFGIVRLTTLGSLDNSFDGDGRVTVSFASGGAAAEDVIVQPDGKILVAGTRNLTRLLPSGALDNPFGGGTGRSLVPDFTDLNDIALMPDGRIVLTGRSTLSVPAPLAVVRLDSLGFLDSTFNGNGRNTLFITASEINTGTAVGLQPDGKVIVGAQAGFVPNFGLARFNLNGTLDTTFGTGGRVITDFSPDADRLEALALLRDGRIIAVGSSNGTSSLADFGIARYQGSSARGLAPRSFDFDTDGRDDFFVYRPAEGNWYIRNSTQPPVIQKWGLANDQLVPADYDGDGRTDVAVWRPADGNFYILNSSNGTFRVLNLGLSGDVPVHGDWDGDGRSDPAVYRAGAAGGQSIFYFRGSLNNPQNNITFVPWGTTGDVAVRGDFDGDARMDAAVYRTSTGTWWVRQSSNQQIRFEQWGISTDRLVPADYDGDRRTDLAVYRDGTWFIRPSGGGASQFIAFGTAGDTPVPGDYDGDGRADPTIYRAGQWWSRQGFAGISIVQWGLPTDAVFQ